MTRPIAERPASVVDLPPGIPAPVGMLAALQRARQQLLAGRALSMARRLWASVDPRSAQASWNRGAGRAMLAGLTAIQVEAARDAQSYVAAALVGQEATPDPAGRVVASAFAGMAADGRPLDTLLSYPAFEVAAFVDQGMDPDVALTIGGRHLDRTVMTETQDAARAATGVAVVNDRRAHGYIRYLTLPSCARCVLLAGRWYAYSSGFLRHPQCDCVMLPAAEVVEPQSPRAVFDAMPEQEQDSRFTRAGAQAIRDGSDLGRVVNARRGMYTAGGRKLTMEATTRRGINRRIRLTPEQIYQEAAGDRDEALRLLRRFGYII